MNDYSQFLVLFLLLPVVIQIILPLGMLIVFGLFRAMNKVFREVEEPGRVKNDLPAGANSRLARI